MGFKREVKVTPSLFFFFIFCFFCGCLALFNGLWFLAVYYHFETTLVFLAPPVFEEIRDISWIGYMGLDIYRESLLTSYASSFNNNLAVVVWDMAPVEFDLQLVDFYMLNFTSDFIEFDFFSTTLFKDFVGFLNTFILSNFVDLDYGQPFLYRDIPLKDFYFKDFTFPVF